MYGTPAGRLIYASNCGLLDLKTKGITKQVVHPVQGNAGHKSRSPAVAPGLRWRSVPVQKARTPLKGCLDGRVSNYRKAQQ